MIVKIRSRLVARAAAVPRRLVASLAAPRRADDAAPAAWSRTGGTGNSLVGRDIGPATPAGTDARAFGDEGVRRARWPRRLAIVALATSVMLVVAVRGTGYRYVSLPVGPSAAPASSDGAPREDVKSLSKENRKLRAEMARHSPRGTYIVVDRANNRLYLRRADQVVLEATCSSGSGMVLHDPNGERRWIFDTPTGTFRVLSKSENPVWRKPDWAFVEENLAVPKDPGERIEYGVLGEYGLYFGDGFLIHGTLYERLLGRSVTHGCVRLGRDDLRQVYRAATIGTPIYIF